MKIRKMTNDKNKMQKLCQSPSSTFHLVLPPGFVCRVCLVNTFKGPARPQSSVDILDEAENYKNFPRTCQTSDHWPPLTSPQTWSKFVLSRRKGQWRSQALKLYDILKFMFDSVTLYKMLSFPGSVVGWHENLLLSIKLLYYFVKYNLESVLSKII